MKNLQLSELKAFSIFIATKKPVTFFLFVYSMMSETILLYSPIYLPLIKPNCCSPTIDGKTTVNLFDKTFNKIL